MGPSGLRFEHLKVCLESWDLSDLLSEMVQRVVGVRGPPRVVGQALAAARLIALAKENGDVRPIAVGVSEVFLCSLYYLQERASMAATLTSFCTIWSISGGWNRLSTRSKLVWSCMSIKCDLFNDFNSSFGASIFCETSQHLPSSLPFTTLLYGQPSPLIYCASDSMIVLTSQEGLHQGDPLGPFYLRVAINVQRRCDSITCKCN